MDEQTFINDLFDTCRKIEFYKQVPSNAPNFNEYDAVEWVASKNNSIKNLDYREYKYEIGTTDPIELSDGIFYQKYNDLQSSNDAKQKIVTHRFKLFTETHDISHLKKFVARCKEEYQTSKGDKIGDNQYYFDQIAEKTPYGSRLPYVLFDHKSFHTCRTFDNVFFEEKEKVQKRVEHFLNNPAWYEEKGIPYTLGFLLTGPPGVGKTSTVKVVANVSKRHIINVRLSEIKTVTQLKALFYDNTINVLTETGAIEKFVIPIKQRIYVIEDIDCMTDLIKRREYKYEEIKKNNDEKKESDKEHKNVEKKPLVEEKMTKKELEDYEEYRLWAVRREREDQERETKSAEDHDKVTYDILLNIIDGPLENWGRIIFITSNFPEVIDEALIRPGRVDISVNYKLANKKIVKEILEHFYNMQFPMKDFEKIRDYKITPAQVTQIAFQNIDDHTQAIKTIMEITNKRIVKESSKKKQREMEAPAE